MGTHSADGIDGLIHQATSRQRALEAVGAAGLAWQMGLISGIEMVETIARHRDTLAYLHPAAADPGLHLAWPEALQEPELVPGVDFLPPAELVAGAVNVPAVRAA
jgi:hypothetical protein